MGDSVKVTFLNPSTCGIYTDGGTRYRIDKATSQRTKEIDNELLDHVNAYFAGESPPGSTRASIETVFDHRVLVPAYFDSRHNRGIQEFLGAQRT